MAEVEQQVLEESQRFRASLPDLIGKYSGQWVVFREGEVWRAFEEEEEAYVAAVGNFGVKGAFVIARVAEDALEPVPVSSSLFLAKP